jgi:hypothetical protein
MAELEQRLMAKRLLVCSSYDGVSQQTQRGINECLKQGWATYIQTGCADVALARNIALTAILDQVPDDDQNAILMVDDDIVFTLQDAERICAMACDTGQAVSAIYPTADGRMAAMRLKPKHAETEPMFLTGLGFLAIPANCFHELVEDSEQTTHAGKQLVVFTWTAPANWDERQSYENTSMWLSEDYRLTLRLGGVLLAKLGVGHLKEVPLYPDKETLERFGKQIGYRD